MKTKTCVECGQWAGHFQGCPEAPEPLPPEPSDWAMKAAVKIVDKLHIDYRETQDIAGIIDEAFNAST